jgi:hypothetical protein
MDSIIGREPARELYSFNAGNDNKQSNNSNHKSTFFEKALTFGLAASLFGLYTCGCNLFGKAKEVFGQCYATKHLLLAPNITIGKLIETELPKARHVDFDDTKCEATEVPCSSNIEGFLNPVEENGQEKTEDNTKKEIEAKLDKILEKTKQYCRRLESFVFDFVCLEEITEKIDHSREISREIFLGREGVTYQHSIPGKIQENKYLYEYQLIRKKGKSEESRTLIEKNGEKKNEKGAKLEAFVLYYENITFGPINLVGEDAKLYYDYRIVKDETLNQEGVVIIEAIPKSSFLPNLPFGKIWVKESDFAISKIEWDYESLRNYQFIEDRAKKYKAKPQITLRTEYGIEKNGIRFQSRLVFEEAYINPRGDKFTRSKTTVKYKDYRFFTVEVDIKLK